MSAQTESATTEGVKTDAAPDRHSIAAAFDRLPGLVNGDQTLLRRGKYLSVDFMLEIGTQAYYLTIDHGQIKEISRGPLMMRSWAFAIRGDETSWMTFWQPTPPPGFHDLFALVKRGAFRIDGDYRPLLTNLLYFKALLAAPRALSGEPR